MYVNDLFDGQVALVTGASRGIGRAIAQDLAALGARVMLTSRNAEALEESAGTMRGEVTWFAANAGDPNDVAKCLDETWARLGPVDLLVNNAATNPYFGPALGISSGQYDKTLQVNLTGPLLWIKGASDRGFPRGSSVLNISSIGGLRTEPGLGIYNVTKAALLHLTRVLAAELGPTARVNALAPGVVRTDLAKTLWEEREEELARAIPLGRIGEPADIAAAALFLLSPGARWITGEVIVVDGGTTL